MFNPMSKILQTGTAALAERMFPGAQLFIEAHRAMNATGVVDKPQTKISSLLTLLTCLGTALYREQPIESVFLTMVGLLPNGDRLLEAHVIHEKSIQAARVRLGFAALELLFESIANKIPVRFDVCGLIPIAMDGSYWSLYDSDEISEAWNRPQSQYGDGSYPQFLMMSLVTTFDWVIRKVKLYPVNTDEHRAAFDFLDYLTPLHLLLLDRGLPSFALMSSLMERNISFVARLPVNRNVTTLIHENQAGDSLVCLKGDDGKQIQVRLIEFTVADEVVRLATTLSHYQAPTKMFFQLYHLRWKIESTLNLLKNALMGGRQGRQDLSLRSQRPDLVVQEFYAMAIVYNLIRNEGRIAVGRLDKDPSDYSFSSWRDNVKRAIERNLPAGVREASHASPECRHPKRKREEHGETRTYAREVRYPPGQKKYKKRSQRHEQTWIRWEAVFQHTERTLRAQRSLLPVWPLHGTAQDNNMPPQPVRRELCLSSA